MPTKAHVTKKASWLVVGRPISSLATCRGSRLSRVLGAARCLAFCAAHGAPCAATTGSTARVRTQGPLTSAGCGDPRTPRGLVPNLLFGFSSVVVLGWSCPCSCPFHLKPRDRRQLMPTKALVSKKDTCPQVRGCPLAPSFSDCCWTLTPPSEGST